MNAWLLLFVGVACETFADASLKLSEGLSKWLPSLFVVAGYLSALFLFSNSLKTLPLSQAYAVWAGAGIIGATLVGVFFFQEKITGWHILGIALIVAGMVLINLVSHHTK